MARSYYRAARREAPFTLRGDLWAAVQWGRTFALNGETPLRRPGRGPATRPAVLSLHRRLCPGRPRDLLRCSKVSFTFCWGQYQQALPPLLQALEAPQIQREYIFVLFPALAADLDPQRSAWRTLAASRASFAAEGSHTQYFIPLVETLAGDRAKRGAL